MHRVRLGVNVDHVATIRQQRGTRYPDPVTAAALCELAGADQVTIHLREDRRHIQDRDVSVLRQTIQTVMNLEMAATEEMKSIALATEPDTVTIVPEKREEQTTEGGLDVAGQVELLGPYVAVLREAGITVSLFVDPEVSQIDASAALGAHAVELHTGDYCEASPGPKRDRELDRVIAAAQRAEDKGLMVVAGHGLDYDNTRAIAAIPEIEELNIGHSIVARAVLVGMERAVGEMIDLIRESEA